MADLSTTQSQAVAASFAMTGRAQSPQGLNFWENRIEKNGLQNTINRMLDSSEVTSAPRTDANGNPVNNPVLAPNTDTAQAIEDNLLGTGAGVSLTDLYPNFDTDVNNGNVAEAITTVLQQAGSLQDFRDQGIVSNLGAAGTVVDIINNRADAAQSFADEFAGNNKASWDVDDTELSQNVLDGDLTGKGPVGSDPNSVPSGKDIADAISKDEGQPEPATFTISADKDSVTEGQTVTHTIATGDGDNVSSDTDLTVKLSGNGITADDFEGVSSLTQTVTIASGESSTTLALKAAQDQSQEGDETVTATVTDSGESVSTTISDGATNIPGLPDLPTAQGGTGPDAVDKGTSASENINGNQDGATVSGNGGSDRFIVTQQNTSTTIDDFQNGDQVFFDEQAFGDINLKNNDTTDGQLTLSAGQASVTLTNLGNLDAQAVTTKTFEDTFGDRGIGTEGNPFGAPAGNNAPTVAANQSFSVGENASNGQAIGSVSASDSDGSVDSFAITGGNTDEDGDGNSPFSIANSGELSVNDADDIDLDGTNDSFTLDVEATDNDGATGTGSVDVSVTSGQTVSVSASDDGKTLDATGSATSNDDNVTFEFAQDTYGVTLDQFAAGDDLEFFGNTDASVSLVGSSQTSGSDGKFTIEASADGDTVTVDFTNVDPADDMQITGISAFESTFNTGSIA